MLAWGCGDAGTKSLQRFDRKCMACASLGGKLSLTIGAAEIRTPVGRTPSANDSQATLQPPILLEKINSLYALWLRNIQCGAIPINPAH